jgi:N-acetylmuramoyl-L-alanine amidase CwlA
MKKLIKSMVVVMLLAGSALVDTLSAKATSSEPIQTDNAQQPETQDYSNIISIENGKDQIKSTAPGKYSLMVYSSFERDGEFILFNSNTVPLYTKPNGTGSGDISPQVVLSKHRSGQWFLIDTYLGKRWVYNDENIVELRDLDVKNAKLSLKETVYIYSQPFASFRTNETIAPTTVNVVKQAGSWFLVDYNSQQVWITTEKAKYGNLKGTFDTTNIYGVPYKKMIIPTGNKSVRPEYPLNPGYITVHNTANPAVGATADMHGRYLLNLAATNQDAWVSWHFTVDDKQIVQHLPLDESAFHAGDDGGPGNRSSIAIEIAENADGNQAKAEENAKKLISYLMNELHIPIERIKRHQDWSGKYCPRVILNNGWPQFMTSLQQVYNSYRPKPPLYRIVTGAFLGENNVKQQLNMLRTEMGWWATYEPIDQITPYYEIVTGEFLGENKVKEAMNAIKSETVMWMTYEKTRPAYSLYHVVTGGFYGKENVERALEALKKDTGWWATYVPTNEPNIYCIVTGGFAGEANVKEALGRVRARGWWATYENDGETIYYYIIRTGEFLGESNVKNGLTYFTKRGWWATYGRTGNVERYYRIVTGAFGGSELVEQNAQMLRDTRGWWVTTQKIQ